MDKRLLSITEASRQYNLPRSSLYQEVARQRLRILKRGRRTFVSTEDMEAWVERLREETERTRSQRSIRT